MWGRDGGNGGVILKRQGMVNVGGVLEQREMGQWGF